MFCCRHSSAVDNPASPCFRIAMICSSLCRVPFTLLLLPGSACHFRHASFRDKSGSGELTLESVQLLGAGSLPPSADGLPQCPVCLSFGRAASLLRRSFLAYRSPLITLATLTQE